MVLIRFLLLALALPGLMASAATAQVDGASNQVAEIQSNKKTTDPKQADPRQPSSEHAGTEAVREEFRTLLRRMESVRFQERQLAASELLKVRLEALPVLEEEAAAAPPAVGAQLQNLLPRLRERLFNERLQAFVENPKVDSARELPEWDRFSEIAGRDPDDLQVYYEMLLAEPDLFAARMFRSRDLPARMEARSTEIFALCNGRLEDEFPVASGVALMLLGSDSNLRLPRATSTNITAVLGDPRFETLLVEGVHAKTLRGVAEAWIQRPGIAVERPLICAMKHQLSAGRLVAIRTLETEVYDQKTYFALLCLGSLKNPSDISVVERFLSSSQKLWPAPGQEISELLPDGKAHKTFAVQTRDVALAVALHLRGENPHNFGIQTVASEQNLFTVESLGFDTDAERDLAIAEYRRAFPDAVVSNGP